MKKTLFCIFTLFACFGVFAQQPVVAVAPFDAISGISATDANMITRVFFIRLGNTNRVSLVDRNVVDRVLREHHFQAGDWSNTQKTAELGNALNADWIVRGELERFGSNILVTVQFYDIRTFRFMGGADILLANAEEAMGKMDPLVDKLVETIANTGAGSQRGGSTGRTYNIGDRGPGGGFIFYAEGGLYMEVSLMLGTFNWNQADQTTKNYRGGEFNNWRLPSIGELEMIYTNLRRRNLAGLGDDQYWSSSLDSYNDPFWLDFSNGSRGAPSRSSNRSASVRAVRSF